jgi:hypothetical protein
MEKLYKMVDGALVEMSEAEAVAIRAEWEANANTPAPPAPTKEQLLAEIAALAAKIEAMP